jgi:hypothetical protein
MVLDIYAQEDLSVGIKRYKKNQAEDLCIDPSGLRHITRRRPVVTPQEPLQSVCLQTHSEYGF